MVVVPPTTLEMGWLVIPPAMERRGAAVWFFLLLVVTPPLALWRVENNRFAGKASVPGPPWNMTSDPSTAADALSKLVGAGGTAALPSPPSVCLPVQGRV